MKYFLLIIIPLFFTGCINKQGISFKYYPECYEYYDYYGVYHKKCENNEYEFKTDTGEKLPPACLDCN